MTTATTVTMAKTAKKRTSRKSPPLPSSADVANVAGRDFVIMPLDDFEEWFDDMLLMAVADERLRSNPQETIPMKEVFARQAAKRSRK